MDAQIQRNQEFRIGSIVLSDPINNKYILQDKYQGQIQINLTVHDDLLAIPAVGEIWMVKRMGSNDWVLDKKLENGEESISISQMRSGDRRLEAETFYLTASGVNIKGKDSINLNAPNILLNGNPIATPSSPIFTNNITVLASGTTIGTQPALNIITSGTNFTANIVNNNTQNRIDISFSLLSIPSITSVALGSFPPANPQDGQAVALILPATYDPVAGRPIRWVCVFDAALGMWHVSGPALFAEVTTADYTASAAYGPLATTTGPSIALPRPGDYTPWVGYRDAGTTTGHVGRMSYSIGGSGAIDANAAVAGPGTSAPFNIARPREQVGLGAVTLTAQYRADAATNTWFQERWMRVEPTRIS